MSNKLPSANTFQLNGVFFFKGRIIFAILNIEKKGKITFFVKSIYFLLHSESFKRNLKSALRR